jgi:hypothetical protein
MTPSEFGHAVLMRAIKLVFTTKIDLDEARRLARGQILQEARAEAKRAKRKATPAASRRDDDDPGGIGARLRERIFKIIDSLETVATPSAWPAVTARAGERSGARSTPDERTPRTPAARAAEEPSSGNIVGIFAGPSPTGATRIDHEFPIHPAVANWHASLERNRRGGSSS